MEIESPENRSIRSLLEDKSTQDVAINKFELIDKKNAKALYKKMVDNFVIAFAKRNLKLNTLDIVSIKSAFHFCCEYDLDPSQDMVDLIQRGNKLCADLGVKGYRKLLMNNPRVATIINKHIYEGDIFEESPMDSPPIRHIVSNEMRNNADKKLVGTYAVAKLKSGEYIYHVSSLEDISESKKAAKGSAGSWEKNYLSMCLNVPLKRLGYRFGLILNNNDYADYETEEQLQIAAPLLQIEDKTELDDIIVEQQIVEKVLDE